MAKKNRQSKRKRTAKNKRYRQPKTTPVVVKVNGNGGRDSTAVSAILKPVVIVILCITLVACVCVGVGEISAIFKSKMPWGVHQCKDKDGDHYCDVLGCGECIPVDENKDGICDICNACIHVDEDGDCKCDRCEEEHHKEEDGDNTCDNCGKEGVKPTNIELLLSRTWGGVKNVFRLWGNGLKAVFEPIGDFFEDLFPNRNKDGAGNNGDDIIENPNGCEHIDADNNGYCDKCDSKLIYEEQPNAPENPDTPDGTDTPTFTAYTVTFDANGGVLTVDYTTKETNENGCLTAFPGAHLSGYKLEGWYTERVGGEKVTSATVFTSNTTIYAQWVENNPAMCIHIDEDGDGACDKCGFEMPDFCIHVDVNDDYLCDICGEEFDDGDEDDKDNDDPEECKHIDENGDKFCDECGAIMRDNPEGTDRPGESDECEHRDEDDDGKCDKCGADFEDGDEPTDEPEQPECEHRDADDDGKCDKCGEDFEDGDEPTDEPDEPEQPECEHRDADDDGKCDKCGEDFQDGDEPTDEPDEPEQPDECEHRDADDDGKCDKCGEDFEDGAEPSEEPDEPEQPDECEHRDADDDGKCDKCGEDFEDGEEPDECEHRDADDDGKCDKCGEDFEDGEEPDECEHRDEDDDGECDKCGEDFWDGKDYGDFFDKTEFELVEHYDENRNVYYWYYELSEKGDFSYLVLYASDTGYIPDEIDGNPVVGLADYFYDNCLAAGAEEGSGAYVIPARIAYIGDYAFANAGYSSYVQEDPSLQILGIGDLAFVNNQNLTFIELNCAVSCKFGERIFMGCINLTEENIWIYGYKPD